MFTRVCYLIVTLVLKHWQNPLLRQALLKSGSNASPSEICMNLNELAKQDECALIFGRPDIRYLAVKAQLRPIQYVAQDWQGSLAEGSSRVIVTHSISLRLLYWT